jgi:hypothetical protein
MFLNKWWVSLSEFPVYKIDRHTHFPWAYWGYPQCQARILQINSGMNFWLLVPFKFLSLFGDASEKYYELTCILFGALFPLVQISTALNFSCNRRYSSVGIATGYGLDDRGSTPCWGKRFSSTSQCSDRLWSQTTIFFMGTVVFSPESKRSGNDVDHSPPYSAEVKNGWDIPPLPHTSLWRGA